MSSSIKRVGLKIKAFYRDNTLDSTIWLVDIISSRAGFSILKDNFFVPFWVLHLTLLVYVYLVGSVVFQIKYAEGTGDFIKGYVNISIMILTLSNSHWYITKRLSLKVVLTMVKKSDELSRDNATLREKYAQRMAVIKKIVFTYLTLNTLDALCLYLPNQINPTNNRYSMTPCVGLEPLTAFPKRHICIGIILTQHLMLVMVVISFQALLLFLIAHTAAMYHLMSEDMTMFGDTEDLRNADFVKEKLSVLIRRHALILETINRIKALYSMPLGVNFGTNAICILFFFLIPLQEWMKYSPVLIYCFAVFFLYCFLCQRLVNASEVFERAVYNCGWENFNIKEQKMLYVMLIQAQKPISILAADIIPVNIFTFAKTLQAMYKFVTVIKL